MLDDVDYYTALSEPLWQCIKARHEQAPAEIALCRSRLRSYGTRVWEDAMEISLSRRAAIVTGCG